MKASSLVLGVSILGMLCARGNAADDSNVSKLASPKSEDRHVAAAAIRKQRKVMIDGLIGIVKKRVQDAQPDGAMESAVRLLGILRAKEAIPVLIENIDFQPPVVLDEYREIVPPCVQALIEIGNPSAKAIWTRYLPASTKKKLPLYLKVMKGVWGKEICTLLLNAKLKTKLSKEARANFEAALTYFQPEEAKEKPKKDK